MSDVTRILSALERDDPHAATQLLPLVYDELRKLAAGHTFDATAPVHEADRRTLAGAEGAHRRGDTVAFSPEARTSSPAALTGPRSCGTSRPARKSRAISHLPPGNAAPTAPTTPDGK